MTEHATNRIF